MANQTKNIVCKEDRVLDATKVTSAQVFDSLTLPRWKFTPPQSDLVSFLPAMSGRLVKSAFLRQLVKLKSIIID